MLLSFSSANLTFFLFELNLINFSAYCLGFYYAWGTPVLISNTEVKQAYVPHCTALWVGTEESCSPILIF